MDGLSSQTYKRKRPFGSPRFAMVAVQRPRVVIAGTSSGVGKTTISSGVMAALVKRGLAVQSFKIGPDYIDPSYHTHVTKRQSRNLDSYLLSDKVLVDSFLRASADAEISVIEGVMGLFDGLSGLSDVGSTASAARLLKAPVLLAIDAWSSARSIAAQVLGFNTFDPEVKIAGVILNRVAGEKHAQWCTQAIEKHTGVPVLGWLPKSDTVRMPERHLGLIPYIERRPETEKAVEMLAEFVGEHVELNRIVQIASSAPPFDYDVNPIRDERSKVRIGLALDEAFCFYYADAIDLLRACGAEIVNFSPIHDSSLPEGLDGLYLGGGFPEVFSSELERNESMRKSIKTLIEDGMPTFAECGGLMYLTRSITNFDGSSKRMIAVLDAETILTKKLTLGYTLAHAVSDTILSRAGETLRGHEYHFSEIQSIPTDVRFTYEMRRGNGIVNHLEGWKVYNALACYSHTHFCSKPRTASRFAKACEAYSRR